MKQLLVVGARPGSLGYHVAITAAGRGWAVTTAGISGETVEMDVTQAGNVRRLMLAHDWHSVVCTVGINYEDVIGTDELVRSMHEQYMVNTLGVINVLNNWYDRWRTEFDEHWDEDYEETPFCFVALSSNSAHIARSRSIGYCASKAALSMAIRCAARYAAEQKFGEMFNIYGYEPGWINGTPMSLSVLERLRNGEPHRIPGERDIEPEFFSERIVSDLCFGPHYLNGCMMRLDGGEQ